MAYRAAIIGCGRIGSDVADDPRSQGVQSHAGAYIACSDTELVAVCDADPARAERCGRRWGVAEVYSDAETMLVEQRPEVVSVCTPDATHAAVLRVALDSPSVRAILAEKPLALTVEEAGAIVSLAAERGVILAVNYSRRYTPSQNLLKQRLHAASIGTIQSVNGCYTKGIIHNGTHWFDLARFLVGEIASVQGYNFRGDPSDDPNIDAVMRFENGASGHLTACDANAYAVFELDIVGTCGRVRVSDLGQTIETFDVVDSPHYSGYRVLDLVGVEHGGMEDVMLHAVIDLVGCLHGALAPRCSGNDGLAALQIATRARDTAASDPLN